MRNPRQTLRIVATTLALLATFGFSFSPVALGSSCCCQKSADGCQAGSQDESLPACCQSRGTKCEASGPQANETALGSSNDCQCEWQCCADEPALVLLAPAERIASAAILDNDLATCLWLSFKPETQFARDPGPFLDAQDSCARLCRWRK